MNTKQRLWLNGVILLTSLAGSVSGAAENNDQAIDEVPLAHDEMGVGTVESSSHPVLDDRNLTIRQAHRKQLGRKGRGLAEHHDNEGN